MNIIIIIIIMIIIIIISKIIVAVETCGTFRASSGGVFQGAGVMGEEGYS